MATAPSTTRSGAGFKANLSDVLAAIALVQLDRVDAHTLIRERQFALYDEGLAGLEGIEPLARDERDTHALHLYVVRIDAARARARAATSTNARSAEELIARASTSCPCTG